MLARRGFLGVFGSLLAAPAVAAAPSLMKIRGVSLTAHTQVPAWCPPGWLPCDGRPINEAAYPVLSDAYKALRFPMRVPLIEPRENGRQVYLISATDIVRANGSIMRAGVTHPLILPEGA